MSYSVRSYKNITAQRKASQDFYNGLAKTNAAVVADTPVAVEIIGVSPTPPAAFAATGRPGP
jgi:hypothetical protein